MSFKKLRPALWHTVNRDTPCYFFGTMHLPDNWSRRAPKKLLATVDSCDCLVVEHILSESTLREHGAHNVMTDVDTVSPLLGSEATKMLRRRARDAQAAMGVQDMVSTAFDPWLIQRVQSNGKLVSQLETWDEQMAAMGALTADQVPQPPAWRAPRRDYGVIDAEFAKTHKGTKARRLPTIRPRSRTQLLTQLHRAYIRRDLDVLDPQVVVRYSPVGKCWIERHVRMTRRLLALFAETPKMSYFVAVGLSHLLGPANVLELMSLGGVETERDGW